MKWWGKKSLLPGAPDRSRVRTVTATPSWSALYAAAGGPASYAEIVKNSPGMTAVVRTLATNGAELAIVGYQLPSTVLPTTNALAKLLARPNRLTSGFEFRRDIYADLTIYENSYWAKVRDSDDRVAALVRLPAHRVALVTQDQTDIDEYQVQFDTGQKNYPASDVLHFSGYNPVDSRLGVSKIEALKGVLAEERAATESRAGFWKNSARREGLVQRPSTAAGWSDEERDAWRTDFEATMTGKDNAGRVALLEDDMQWHDTSFSAQESEFVAGRLMCAQVIFATYGVPLQYAGAGDRNTQQARRSLYQDAVLPLASLIDATINRDLVPDVLGTEQTANGRIYVATGVDGVVRGDLQMQMEILTDATGGPILTANEGRGKVGLPPVSGGDVLRQPIALVPVGTPQGETP